MTMYKTLDPRNDVDRLYVPRKAGGRGLANTEGSVDASIQWLKSNIEKREGILITATSNNSDDTRISKTEITRKQKWEEKQLSRRFKHHLTRENVNVA